MLGLINRLTDDRKASGVEEWLEEEARRDRAAELEEEDGEDEE